MWAPVLGRCVGLPCALRVYVHTSGCHARMTLGSSIIFFYAEHAHTLLAQLSVFCAGLVVKGCNLSTDQTTIDYLRRDSAENYPVRLNSSQRIKRKLRVPPERDKANHQGPISKPTEIFDYYGNKHNEDDAQSCNDDSTIFASKQ